MSVNETVGNAAARDEEQAVQPKTNWSLTDAFALANTLANHGWTRDANADAASSCIYALCRLLKDGGDAAAMREALVKLVDFCSRLWKREKLTPLLERARAALAKPPRNCDKFQGDIEELREACLRERGLNPDEDFPEIFCEWLLAAAKKGGAQ